MTTDLAAPPTGNELVKQSDQLRRLVKENLTLVLNDEHVPIGQSDAHRSRRDLAGLDELLSELGVEEARAWMLAGERGDDVSTRRARKLLLDREALCRNRWCIVCPRIVAALAAALRVSHDLKAAPDEPAAP